MILKGNVYKIFNEAKKEGRKHPLEPKAKRMYKENETLVTRFKIVKIKIVKNEISMKLADETSDSSFSR